MCFPPITRRVIASRPRARKNRAMQISTDVPSFGPALRDCRQARKLSQLELAMNAEVSQRHLSFLESGRAQPSRPMILQLAEALNLPLRDRNRLLLSAGFAPVYPQRDLASTDMAPVRRALDLLLSHHEPYPAVVVDRAWNLVQANPAALRMVAMLGDPMQIWQQVCPDGRPNILKLTFHPQGMRPHLVNFDEIAPFMLARTQQEALEHPQVAQVLEEILAYPGLSARMRNPDHLTSMPLPVLPTHLRVNGTDLRMFSMLATFGTPLDVTTDELRVESFFPADAASEALLRTAAGK